MLMSIRSCPITPVCLPLASFTFPFNLRPDNRHRLGIERQQISEIFSCSFPLYWVERCSPSLGYCTTLWQAVTKTPKIIFAIRYITLFFLLNFWWQKYRDSTSEGVYDLRIFVPEFPIIPQESSSSSDEYSKTGRNPTNNPMHDFLIVILADTEKKLWNHWISELCF